MELLCTCYHWAPIERRLLSNGRQERERAEKCSEKELNVGKKELKGERLSEDGGEMYTERIAWNIHWEWILFDYGYIYSCISFDSAAAAIVVLIALPDSPQNLSAIVCDCDIRKTNCEYIGKAFQSCCMQGKKPHTKALHVQYIRWQAEN